MIKKELYDFPIDIQQSYKYYQRLNLQNEIKLKSKLNPSSYQDQSDSPPAILTHSQPPTYQIDTVDNHSIIRVFKEVDECNCNSKSNIQNIEYDELGWW